VSAVAAIQQRLTDQGVFEGVSGAVAMAAAMDRRQFPREGYVMLTDAKASENELVNAVSQKVNETYTVMFWTLAAGDVTGESMIDAVETRRETILAALLGWQPGEDYAPLTYDSGALNQLVPGAVLWQESFSTTTHVRATA
jgi:hypothetical protein